MTSHRPKIFIDPIVDNQIIDEEDKKTNSKKDT